MLIFKKIIQKNPHPRFSRFAIRWCRIWGFHVCKDNKIALNNKKNGCNQIAAIFQLVTKPKFSFPRHYPSVSCS